MQNSSRCCNIWLCDGVPNLFNLNSEVVVFMSLSLAPLVNVVKKTKSGNVISFICLYMKTIMCVGTNSGTQVATHFISVFKLCLDR